MSILKSSIDLAAGDQRPLQSGLSFFKRGKPSWLTCLPAHRSPGVLSFVVAMMRAVVVSYVLILGMYPFFAWRYEDGFNFGLQEGFLFAFIFAFFEDHARWNYIVNATRPVVAAARFAALISVSELMMAYLAWDENVSFLLVINVRASATAMHFILSYLAAFLANAGRYAMFSVFIVCVVVHSAFNVFGVGRNVLGG